MNLPTFIVLSIVAILVWLAVRTIRKNGGHSCGGCTDCDGCDSCPHCKH